MTVPTTQRIVARRWREREDFGDEVAFCGFSLKRILKIEDLSVLESSVTQFAAPQNANQRT